MTTLNFTWTISKATDTYGYNRLTLTTNSGGKFVTCGGGYDMLGTVVADWLMAQYYDLIKEKVAPHSIDGVGVMGGMYGLSVYKGKYLLNGSCGLDSVLCIGNKIGLKFNRVSNKKGHLLAYYVEKGE